MRELHWSVLLAYHWNPLVGKNYFKLNSFTKSMWLEKNMNEFNSFRVFESQLTNLNELILDSRELDKKWPYCIKFATTLISSPFKSSHFLLSPKNLPTSLHLSKEFHFSLCIFQKKYWIAKLIQFMSLTNLILTNQFDFL